MCERNRVPDYRLARYNRIVAGRERPFFQRCRKYRVEFSPAHDEGELWAVHDTAVARLRAGKGSEGGTKSLLELKIELARRMLCRCRLCERRCGADRTKGEVGYCGVEETHISSEFLHMGEERMLVPSHTVFFSGCTFSCAFCQNWEISQYPRSGQVVPPRQLAEVLDRKGGKNVNWVGGDPAPDILYIMEVLTHLKTPLPQVFNSNMYLSEESMKLLDGLVDLYLTDFKFGPGDCGARLAGVRRYWEVVTRNHLLALQQCELIVRHLVMPRHIECCTRPVLEWLSTEMRKERYVVNIMGQYHPDYRVLWEGTEYPDLLEPLSVREFKAVLQLARALGLGRMML